MQQDTQLRDVTEGSPWGDTRMGAESRSPRPDAPYAERCPYYIGWELNHHCYQCYPVRWDGSVRSGSSW